MAVQGLKPCAIVLGYTVQFSMCHSNRVCVLFFSAKTLLTTYSLQGACMYLLQKSSTYYSAPHIEIEKCLMLLLVQKGLFSPKKIGMLQNHFGSTEWPGFRKKKKLPKLNIQLFNLIFFNGFRYKDASKCVHWPLFSYFSKWSKGN